MNGASGFLYYCAQCERKLQDSVKFQIEKLSLFFSLGLSLFLNCSWFSVNLSLIVNIKKRVSPRVSPLPTWLKIENILKNAFLRIMLPPKNDRQSKIMSVSKWSVFRVNPQNRTELFNSLVFQCFLLVLVRVSFSLSRVGDCLEMLKIRYLTAVNDNSLKQRGCLLLDADFSRYILQASMPCS